jgi:Zn finger protein HypA/HybF involved in hydrogenase expression
MGNKISQNNLEEIDYYCQICKKNKAVIAYSKCGHLGLCIDCHNFILENTTILIRCPKCNKEY